MEEPVNVLSIGSVVGGPRADNAQWREGITRLSRRVAEARSGVRSPLNVNVVFQVPGKMLTPDFEGVRTGKFSKKDSLLMIQVALPEQLPGDVDANLRDRLEAAVDEGERWARARGLADDLAEIRSLIMAL
jgi:hypothetical protein